MGVKISIGTWANLFGEYAKKPITMEEVARRLDQLDFEGVALGGFKPHGHYELYPTKADRRKLVDLFKSHGLVINSYAADLWAFPFPTGGADVAKKYEEAFDKSLEMCVDCGIPIIRVDTVTETPYPADFNYREAWERCVAMFKKCAEKANKANVRVVWEFEPGYIFNKPSEIVKMIKDVGNENFKLQVDTCHVQMCAVVGSVHAPFGTGYIKFEDVVPAIVKAGYTSEWWTIDLCFWPNAWEITEESKTYVDELFTKLNMK